jgi:hypothetical protein
MLGFFGLASLLFVGRCFGAVVSFITRRFGMHDQKDFQKSFLPNYYYSMRYKDLSELIEEE